MDRIENPIVLEDGEFLVVDDGTRVWVQWQGRKVSRFADYSKVKAGDRASAIGRAAGFIEGWRGRERRGGAP